MPSSAAPEIVLALQGLKCPLPVLRTRKALGRVRRGAVVIVECTDPLAAVDIPALVQETGDILETADRSGEVLSFRIRKR
ncbi:sulfurtransferase TusA family protein [Bradyrhizobium sp. WD16]|uniref:sulfurtransferase TusA family protein n=1 Tax=Bradyrhizobium sp. WD16 TaxID=1521768 RepID=UPI0020A3AD9B|nr:sulfurtransferase TusA family protein [Bradyrhizobium sp. WD16]UTD26460.1 preprotein translocase subunit TatB [Bradyrhizobium sp. WD16]